MSGESHPIEVDLERILPILAREIYTSPFAFLRENVQNAFDAIRVQVFRDQSNDISREHQILISVDRNRLSISDTGIGMSRDDLSQFFWSIGKSGKHTSEAKSAGVVGTFGIGGMANFGVCSRLEVLTRPHSAESPVLSFAERSQLSAKENCVFYENGPSTVEPGTTVTGTLLEPISVNQVKEYLTPIVQFLSVPVVVGSDLLSQQAFPSVKRIDGAERDISSGPIEARVYIRAMQNGQAEVQVDRLKWNGIDTDVSAVFSTSLGVVSAYQHGFMLANVPVTTVFGLGGVINSSVLRPTAGREAVTDESRSLVQNLLAAIEGGLATHISEAAGLPERFSSFYRYLVQYGRWDLAGPATVRVFGRSVRARLDSFTGATQGSVFFARDGHDQSIIQAYNEQNKSVVLLSSDGHRQKVERNYLQQLCKASPLEDRVTCIRTVSDLTFSETALKYQLHERLRSQFLIDGLFVRAGELSHNAMLWTPPSAKNTERVLFVDFQHPQISRLVELRESLSFDAVFDIFIRDAVLPHLESAFPDLRKRDFDSLLRKLQSTVEYFEIDPSDVGRIQQLAAITNMSPEDVAAVFGARRPGNPRPTSVGRRDVASVKEQVDRVVEQSAGKSPEETRRELEELLIETDVDAKILDASQVQIQLGLSRYYIALTRDAHVLYRRVFLERNPTTDFSWGGHRAGYLFYSAGSAVVYYDIQFEEVLGERAGHCRSGTKTLETKPLVLRNNVFLPIPMEFEPHMVPTDTTLKFTVRHQILGVSRDGI
ncbi:ATP-binding protein [Sedimenticola selenatireducens]|uniref:ATP-binding protein n=1 Tax=Sedimenticola selenatireducens TaxID=191960 RepID=UPI00048B812C|nr:ATP-binding protein [Sedimenticola selenatireducens]